MKSKAAFVLVLIGVILGFLGSLWGIGSYFLYKNIDDTGLLQLMGASGIFKNILILSLVGSIIGIVLSIILIFYLVKIAKEPSRMDFIIVTILGALGTFLGMGLGGILVLIGGIIGIVKANN